MNLLLWILQFLVAVHTFIGAIWKFSNPEQTVPTLAAIPHGAWLAMGVFELLCAFCLILPAVLKSLAPLATVAAGCIAAEMLLFSALQISSGDHEYGHMVYWLVVAALCLFIGYMRSINSLAWRQVHCRRDLGNENDARPEN
jgi:uncharacterized membrane protein